MPAKQKTSKRKATVSSKNGAPTKKTKIKKSLVEMAEGFGYLIKLHQAKKLWKAACDGPGVTENEFATLQKVLDKMRFKKDARVYLDSLVTKHSSGTSMYKVMDKVKYDRANLDLADHLSKDGSISLQDAKSLWEDVEDGPGVTEVEKRTIEYIRDNKTLTVGANNFLRGKLSAWVAPGSGPRSRSQSSSSSSMPSTTGATSTTTTSTASTFSSQSSGAPFGRSGGFGNGGWHGSTIASRPTFPPVARDWTFDMGGKAFGLFVDDANIYAGDETGLVVKLDLEGKQVKQYRLPEGVKCMVSDQGFLFAGCNNGSLYDLTVDRPRLVAELEDFAQVLWLDIHQGVMAASDASGNVAMVNCEGETLWKEKSEGTDGWMVRVDNSGVYHGHSKGVTKYDLAGKKLWHTPTAGVLFGWMQNESLYASLIEPNCFDGEIAKRLSREGAKQGQVVASLMWNSTDDLDLHVHAPSGEHIYYGHKRSACGGELDVDMNAGFRSSLEPVENIFWSKAPKGHYRISVIDYSHRSTNKDVDYEVHLSVLGEAQKFTGTFKAAGGLRTEQVVHEFDFEGAADDAMSGDELPQKGVVRINKDTGEIECKYDAGSSVPSTTCAPDKTVFAAVPHSVKCFNEQGDQQWQLGTGAGNAMSMQYVGNSKLFAVCTSKVVAMDVSDVAVEKAKKGAVAACRTIIRDTTIAETTVVSGANDLELTTDTSNGVIVVCIKQGKKIRVRPAPGQAGYDENRNTQFPRNIRADGARFLVDGLKLCGSFYRVVGSIKRL